MDEAGSGRGRGKQAVRPQKKHAIPNTNRQRNHRKRGGRMRRPPRGALTLSQRIFFILYFQISAAHRCACEVKSQFQFHVAVLSGQKRKMEKTAAFPEKTSDFDATPPSHAHGHARQHHEKATLHATSVHNTSGTDVFVFQRDHRNKRVYLGRKKQISSNQRRKKGGDIFHIN